MVTTVYHRHNTLSLLCTHTPVASVLTKICTVSQTQPPLMFVFFLGGSFLPVGLLLGPAQVAFHLHKLGGVLLFLLNFLLLQFKLQE